MNRILFVLVIFATLSFGSSWYVKKDVDVMSDKEEKFAIVKNKLGHSFMVYKIGDEVWANFAVSDSSLDTIDYENHLIIRIDKGNATKLKQVANLGKIVYKRDFYIWKPKWINFILGHSVNDQMLKTINLENLMSGNKLKVRYYLSTGGYKDTTFTLKGSTKALKNALNF